MQSLEQFTVYAEQNAYKLDRLLPEVQEEQVADEHGRLEDSLSFSINNVNESIQTSNSSRKRRP